MAAVLMTDKIYQVIADNSEKNIMFGSGFTASAHPVACAVALENIKILEDDKLMERVPILEPQFQRRLKMLEEIDIVGESRGIGLMGAVELVHDKSPSKPFSPVGSAGPVIAECAHKNGLIVRAIGDTLAVCPPLIITEEQIDELFDKFSKSLKDGSEILSSR